jgi:glycosyltransferase involved in cell wall biosynthesis
VAPRLSIIIATYNAAATLRQCLDSTIGQTFNDWELLIADGGSTDGTTAILQEYDSFIAWWKSKPDDGIYDAWNQALGRTNGEYVAFLGADDAWRTPSTLYEIFQIIDGERYDLVTSRGVLVSDHDRHYEFGNEWNHSKVARRMTICHPGAFHRRDLFDRFGTFNTNYRISADYEFLLRLPVTLCTRHIPIPTVNIADGGVSRRRRWAMLAERYHIQRKCPRVGRVRAVLNLLDKLWRVPIAKILGIPN